MEKRGGATRRKLELDEVEGGAEEEENEVDGEKEGGLKATKERLRWQLDCRVGLGE